MSRDRCDLWLWDGRTELEGRLTRLEGPLFVARLRAVRKPERTLGQRLSPAPLELLRAYARRRWLAHLSGPDNLPLVEIRFDSVQPSSDGEFEIVAAGRLDALAEEERELLRKMPVEAVAALMQRRVS